MPHSLSCYVESGQMNVLEDIAILESRVTTPDSPNYPINALHVFKLNDDVNERNTKC